MAKASIIHFGSEALELPELADGSTRVTYHLEDFDGDSGIHIFIRLLPLLAPMLEQSSIPLDQFERLGPIFEALFQIVEDGRLDWQDVGPGLTLAAEIGALVGILPD